MMKEIYYIEDDETIARSVKEYLEGESCLQNGEPDCRVKIFGTIAEAKKALLCQRPSLLLADWNMPDGGGDDFCRWVRTRWSNLPFIFITVRGEAGDMVSGFQKGADDYVVKPFKLEVLRSRILALLRRMGQEKEPCLFCGSVLLDTEKMAVFCHEEEVDLSWPEYQLLLALLENKGRTLTRGQLLERVWDNNGNHVNDNTLTVTMKRLREKLGNPGCLKTIRSFGYRMEEME